jgi:hypothetical protein
LHERSQRCRGKTAGGDLGVGYWHTKQDEIPVPGKKYVVEIDLAIFETVIPPHIIGNLMAKITGFFGGEL